MLHASCITLGQMRTNEPFLLGGEQGFLLRHVKNPTTTKANVATFGKTKTKRRANKRTED